MEIYVFFLLLSLCAGQYFDENKVKACSADSTFLQPEKQCHEFCAVSKKLGRGTITFKRNVTSTRNSDKIDTRAESSSVDAQDSESMPFCTIVISSSCVAVLLLTCFCCIIFFLIMRKSRSNEHTDNDQCPLLLNSREDRASQSQERRSDTRRSSPTMTNDSNLSGRKKYDETPMGNDESSDVKDTDKCKTLNHPHTTVNQTTDQCANLEEVPNSRILNDIRELKERMVCKVCLNGKMCVVFLPCNHMVACENCSVMLDRCAVCRTVIKGTLTVYTQF